MPLIRKDRGDISAAAGPDIEALVRTLRDGDPDERWSAARRLAGLDAAAGPLGAAVSAEPDTRVREAIFTSLASLADGRGAAAIAPHLRSDDANLRTGALDALRAMGGAAAPLLPALLRDPDADVRGLVCDLTRQLPSGQATALLCERLDSDPEVNVCAAAVDVLAEIGDAAAVPALERCAARFSASPFLGFAIRIVLDRIAADDEAPA